MPKRRKVIFGKEEMFEAALEILAESPMRPSKLIKQLRKRYGASRGDANLTYLQLVSSRSVRNTLTGKLKLR